MTEATSVHRGVLHCQNNDFGQAHPSARRNVNIVFWVTLVTMAAEIAAGWKFDSMALLADGWHMGSHALALGLASYAYSASSRLARDRRFAFGTWKIEVLAGFSSALLLLVVAVLMVFESVERFVTARQIHYQEALGIAVLGLVVNLVSALILGGGHDHASHAGSRSDKEHRQEHRRGGGHTHDLNLKSAFVHVLTDAATSVLAILALAGGWWWGLDWLDPLMGIVGAVLISYWAKGLLSETGRVLLDREMDHPVVALILARTRVLVSDAGPIVRILDFHAWRVGRESFAVVLAVEVRDATVDTEGIRNQWVGIPELVHATVEIRRIEGSAKIS